MAGTSSTFTLGSTQTALAILPPPHLTAEIDKLRGTHDKAFGKWDAHINILYPFIPADKLEEAVEMLKRAVEEKSFKGFEVELGEVGVFRHKRNATVWLGATEGREELLALREVLVGGLGVREGSDERGYTPHLTVGQEGLGAVPLQRLVEKVGGLKDLKWDVGGVVVLRREGGVMRKVDEILFAGREEDLEGEEEEAVSGGEKNEVKAGNKEKERERSDDGWKPCFSFQNSTWKSINMPPPLQDSSSPSQELVITSFNLMADAPDMPAIPPFRSRLPLFIEALSSSNLSTSIPNVLCLQEVNKPILDLLLSHPFLQTHYPYCSHSPISTFPSHRNLVTFASEPFSCFLLEFQERHKTALIIDFFSRKIQVVNVHLTSALTNESVLAKKRQMDILTRFIQPCQEVGKTVIVAGDFNTTTSTQTIETALARSMISSETALEVMNVVDAETWEDAFLCCYATAEGGEEADVRDGEEGATFDRMTNPYAAMSKAPIDNRPQRYDRVLYWKESGIQTKRFEIIGRTGKHGRCVSDHFGVCAVLELQERKGLEERGKVGRLVGNSGGSIISLIDDDTDLTTYLDPYLPTESDRLQREDAIQLLQTTLSSGLNLGNIILAPLGSYLLSTYFSSSDVDILAIGSIPPRQFFELAAGKLKTIAEEGFKGVHFVNSLVSIIEVCVKGVKFDVQYCQAPEILERYHSRSEKQELQDLVFDKKLIGSLHPTSLRPLNTYRDTAYLLNTLPFLPSYRLAHRFLCLYLKNRGLYSAKFGYLGGIHLSLMLNHVVKLLALSHPNIQLSPASIVRSFFTYYSTFDWADKSITDPSLSHNPTRSPRDAIFIHAIHTPTARPNVASSCTKLSAHTLTLEFSIAARHLKEGEWEWCLRYKEDAVQEFLGGYRAFVKIEMDVWDVEEMGERVREVVGGLESKIPRLLVALGRLSGVEGRAWPGRFRVPSLSQPDMKGTPNRDEERYGNEEALKGYYLIGISASGEQDKERNRLMEGKIITAVREFERSVKESREMEGSVWISMEVVPKRKISDLGLVLDEREWDSLPSHTLPAINSLPPSLSHPPTPPTSTPLPRRSPSSPKSTPLRPAQDILSRIRWDPTLNPEDYLIGYEDRFIGVQEMPFEKWKGEMTDEEFIPMHRIVWVRRRVGEGNNGEGNGGVKVWDRKEKVDLLFGSGRGVGR